MSIDFDQKISYDANIDYNIDNIDNIESSESQLYALASSSFIDSLNEGTSTKIISTGFKEPEDYIEAINSIYKEQWLDAMHKELDSLKSNNTWDLVTRPRGVKPLKTRWVYKIKNPKNSTDLKDIAFKARYVAKSIEQLYIIIIISLHLRAVSVRDYVARLGPRP
jgi:hypothetical protein